MSRTRLAAVAALSAILCVGLTVWNLSKLIQGPPVPPPPSAFHMKQALYMAAIKVEAYRRELPPIPPQQSSVQVAIPGRTPK